MLYEKLKELGIKVTKNIPKGSTILFPDGYFLDLYENRDKIIQSTRHHLIHFDIERFILENKLFDYVQYAEKAPERMFKLPGCNKKILLVSDNAIYLQDGTNWDFENCYIELPKEKLTEAQEKALLLWLDNLRYTTKLKNGELQVVKEAKVLYFDLYDTNLIAEDILKKIKMLYRG